MRKRSQSRRVPCDAFPVNCHTVSEFVAELGLCRNVERDKPHCRHPRHEGLEEYWLWAKHRLGSRHLANLLMEETIGGPRLYARLLGLFYNIQQVPNGNQVLQIVIRNLDR